jgi:hypothetical protein
MKAVKTSETSVNFYQSTRHDIPEGGHLHINDLTVMAFGVLYECVGKTGTLGQGERERERQSSFYTPQIVH